MKYVNICIYKSCEPRPEAQAVGEFGVGTENEGWDVKSCKYVHGEKTKVFYSEKGRGFSSGKAEKIQKMQGMEADGNAERIR